MPGKPYQSKLVPYEAFVRECISKRGYTLDQTVAALLKEKQLKVSRNALHSFIKVRHRQARGLTRRGRYHLPPPSNPPPAKINTTTLASRRVDGLFDPPDSDESTDLTSIPQNNDRKFKTQF